MKVISWNCNLNLVKKFELIEQYKPDIAIIQECEKLDKSYFPNSEYWWIGKDEKKGLGIIIFNKSAKISNSYNENLIYFLPLQTDGIKILGTWAYNHRAKQRFGDGFKGSVSDAINHYKDWLLQDDKIMVSGDFNNSVLWDRGDNINNFKNINQKLNEFNFISAYHQTTKENFGEEKQSTLFHTKDKNKPYFIDYLYIKNIIVNNFKIGDYEKWISFSDHMPLIVELLIND
tara:strand:- start:172 stop:864 length:693 start_codon:yes stop_codon:yes gene_type:complete